MLYTIRLLNGYVAWEGEASSLVEAMSRVARRWPVPLHGIDFRGLDLSGIPVVADIDRAILDAIEQGCTLNMSRYHGTVVPTPEDRFGTTHCRAGFAIYLAGQAGFDLEDEAAKYTAAAAAVAGALIYAASRPGVPIPAFHVSNEEAMADLRECARRYSTT